MKVSTRFLSEYIVSMSAGREHGEYSVIFQHPMGGHHEKYYGDLPTLFKDLVRLSRVARTDNSYMIARSLHDGLHRISRYFDSQPVGTLLWCDDADTHTFVAIRKRDRTSVIVWLVSNIGDMWMRASFTAMVEMKTHALAFTHMSNEHLAKLLCNRLKSFNGKVSASTQVAASLSISDREWERDHRDGLVAPLDDPARSWVLTKLGISERLLDRRTAARNPSTNKEQASECTEDES